MHKLKLIILANSFLLFNVTQAQTLYVPSGTSGIGSSSNAYVGIGTSSPTHVLDLRISENYQGINLQYTTTGNWIRLIGPTLTNQAYNYIARSGDGGIIMGQSSNGFIIAPQLGTTPLGLRVTSQGNVGIRTANENETYALAVNGTIGAKEIQVENTSNAWPDYVFDDQYKLPSLSEIGAYINANKHLPEMPSAEQVEKDGHALGEMDVLLLKKVEELTLYIIEQNKQLEEQNNRLTDQAKEIQALKEQIKR